jgi:hypothetical protein
MSSLYAKVVRQNGRNYLFRSLIEAEKRDLAGLPAVPFDGIDMLVPLNQVAREFGVSRRTIGRRIYEAENAADGDRAAA